MTRRDMTYSELTQLLQMIDDRHSFRKGKGHMIKYVTPIIDMRTLSIHAVEFHSVFDTKVFSITNENKDKDLMKWISEWLMEVAE